MDWDELRGIRDTALLVMDKYQLAIPYSQLAEEQKARALAQAQLTTMTERALAAEDWIAPMFGPPSAAVHHMPPVPSAAMQHMPPVEDVGMSSDDEGEEKKWDGSFDASTSTAKQQLGV